MSEDGIILLAKQSGPTSFKSLNSIKKALGTSKVGHTGTLDSFAQGLLVVCSGRLTRLAGNIVEFDKSYKAVLKFGEETDTLEYTGNVIKTSPLPDLDILKKSINKFTGTYNQVPPAFSAIHVDGKRASSLARNGITSELPSRTVTVFSSSLLDYKLNDNGKVEYAMIDFSVSKGTYIRSLARDIADDCGSSAHLAGLYRTKVGNFNIEEAAGFSNLSDFTIENSIIQMKKHKSELKEKNENKQKGFVMTEEEQILQNEIRNKKKDFSPETAELCGFSIINLISQNAWEDFKNGKPIRSKNFDTNLHSLSCKTNIAVYAPDGSFTGLLEKDEAGRIHYRFVIN